MTPTGWGTPCAYAFGKRIRQGLFIVSGKTNGECDSYKEGEVRPASGEGTGTGSVFRRCGVSEKRRSGQTIGGESNDRCRRRKALRALPGRER